MLRHLSFALLRTPVQSLEHVSAVPGELPPLFLEGVYLSSPEFWALISQKDKLSGKDREKFELALMRYWLRSCTRCTPYGTFAGTAVVDVTGENTRLVLEQSAAHRRSVRLDMNYMTGITQALARLPLVRSQLKFYVNNTLYAAPGGLRYAEYHLKDNMRTYYLTAVDKTSYLEAILSRAQEGATIQDMVDLLMNSTGADADEAAAFVEELCAAQVLVPETEPAVTGQDPLQTLTGQLEAMEGTAALLHPLKEIKKQLETVSDGVVTYQQIEQSLKQLYPDIDVPRNTLQTDLFLSLQAQQLSHELVSAIVKQANDVCLLARTNKNTALEDFRRRMYARYETMEVPLLLALDADLGIGYAGVHDEAAGSSPLIDDLLVETAAGKDRPADHIQAFVFRKYHDYLQQGKSCIEITADELKAMEKETGQYRFPSSMYLLGSLMKQDGCLDAGHFVFDLAAMGGPSAANLLGRFTQGDARLLALTRQLLQEEEAADPGAVYAEIVHLPQARTGNVLLRPVLRGYEIPYAGKSGAPAANQLPVTDLTVQVQGDEMILRSKKLGKRVIPRLSTAHHFGYNSLPVYRFLCDLQAQNLAYPNVWDWGQLSALPHLPRVVYQNLVLRKAQWTLTENDIKDLPVHAAERVQYFTRFRQQRKIPARVVYAEHDNELLIDFEQESGIACLLFFLQRHRQVVLEEFLFTPDNCIVQDVQGKPHTNELVIPLYKPIITSAPVPPVPACDVQRKFYPNSEWMYAKLYTGPKTGEKILKENLLPFIEQGLQQQLFEKCFFIRYKDEFPHLRIRFYQPNRQKRAILQDEWTQWLQPLLNDGLVDRVVMDTYTRELERYGAAVIEEVEQLFCNDSLAILRVLPLLDDADAEPYRLLLALRGIDVLLDDCSLALPQKAILAKQLRDGFFKEFGASPLLQKQLNEKYRGYQQRIFTHMQPFNDQANGIAEAVEAFAYRSRMNKPVLETMLAKIPAQGLAALLPSFIHMFMNRLFIAGQRKYELVVYHFLEKYYVSRLAITQPGKSSQADAAGQGAAMHNNLET